MQGSEDEIRAMQIKDQQARLTVEAHRKRRHFGGPAVYSEDRPGMLLDIRPRISSRGGSDSQGAEGPDGSVLAPDIQMIQQDIGIQVICSMSILTTA